jgi:hypothetical protein
MICLLMFCLCLTIHVFGVIGGDTRKLFCYLWAASSTLTLYLQSNIWLCSQDRLCKYFTHQFFCFFFDANERKFNAEKKSTSDSLPVSFYGQLQRYLTCGPEHSKKKSCVHWRPEESWDCSSESIQTSMVASLSDKNQMSTFDGS